MPAKASLAKPKPKRANQAKVPSPNVVIDLSSDPCWRFTVEEGLLEHANRYLEQGRSAVGLKVTTKLLVEPALDFCSRFTGDEIILATDRAFDVDLHKAGSVTLSRTFVDERILPLCEQFAGTSSVPEKQRWRSRQVVLSCLFIYANHLVKNKDRDHRFIK